MTSSCAKTQAERRRGVAADDQKLVQPVGNVEEAMALWDDPANVGENPQTESNYLKVQRTQTTRTPNHTS